jgi:Bacterial pre-peptidase C-terminal domain
MLRLVAFLALAAHISSLPAQDKKKPADKPAPKVLYSIPLALTPGEKQKVTLRGKNLDAVKDVKASDGATAKVLAARKAGVPNNYPAERVGDTEVEIELELPKGAKAVTLTIGDATFTPLVADTPAVKEKEPNDGFDQAQALTVPCAVDGTIKGEKDADVFKFDGKKGEKLRLEVVAAKYGSPVDAMLTLYDADRRVLDSADDAAGSSDPVLSVTLPKDGTYYLTVIDAHDLGGANFGYRLVAARGK